MPTVPQLLASAAAASPSADNSQPFRYRWDGRRLHLRYDHHRVGGKTFAPGDPATLLSAGCAIGNILQLGDGIGIPPLSWQLPEKGFDEGDYGYADLPSLDEPGPGFDKVAHPLFDRHTNRFPFRKQRIPEPLKEWITAEREEAASACVIDTADGIREAATLVRSASEIRFQIREAHEWLARSLRFSPADAARGDGLDIRTLALPPGGAWFLRTVSDWRRMAFLNRFGVYRALAITDAGPVARAPALVAITSPPSGRQIIAAGRLLVRIWTRLNSEGIAVHPYYVISDQLVRLDQGRMPEHLIDRARMLEQRASRAFPGGGGGERIRMLLRIGYPTRKPPRSRRLPLELVFTDQPAE